MLVWPQTTNTSYNKGTTSVAKVESEHKPTTVRVYEYNINVLRVHTFDVQHSCSWVDGQRMHFIPRWWCTTSVTTRVGSTGVFRVDRKKIMTHADMAVVQPRRHSRCNASEFKSSRVSPIEEKLGWQHRCAEQARSTNQEGEEGMIQRTLFDGGATQSACHHATAVHTVDVLCMRTSDFLDQTKAYKHTPLRSNPPDQPSPHRRASPPTPSPPRLQSTSCSSSLRSRPATPASFSYPSPPSHP